MVVLSHPCLLAIPVPCSTLSVAVVVEEEEEDTDTPHPLEDHPIIGQAFRELWMVVVAVPLTCR